MSKKQIRLTQDGIRRMISEAIQAHSFNGEGFNVKPDSDYDSFGNPKYPEGVFSTDDPKVAKKIRDDFDSYDAYYGESPEARSNKEKLASLIDKRANGEGAELDLPNYGRYETEDEFGDEEKEGQLYDKPFGDLDDAENQWKDEPGYEEDDDDIAGINEGKVTLTEEGLRKFISYSVSKLLKEANLGIMAHFDGKNPYQPENPYKDMSWDEYCEAKRMEREKDQMKTAADKEPNLGVTTHFDGSAKSERNPEDDEHLFDDQYWVDKMNLSKDDLQEMVRKALTGVMERLG